MPLKKAIETEIAKMKAAKVLCIGDVMLDKFIYGDVERISPEAPVPILKIRREEHMLGGAGNVIRNISAFGAEVFFICAVGDDENGKIVQEMIFSYTGHQRAKVFNFSKKTTIKKRFVTNSQQLLRVDDENFFNLTDANKEQLFESFESLVKDVDIVVVSDYGKGLLTKDVLTKIILLANKYHKKIIVDPKSKDFSIYSGIFMITPNKKELHEATNLSVDGDDNIVISAKSIIASCKIENVLVTRSSEGMSLVEQKGSVSHFPALAKEVFDVSGAGDTVVAAMACSIGGGCDVVSAATIANIAGSVVVSKKGTAVAYPDELIKAFNESRNTQKNTDKIVKLEKALDIINLWKARGLQIAFTNGCFDLLHPGHVSLLEQAKETCGKLVVGLNSDSSIKRLKGETRPIQNEISRAVVLSSLSAVDLIIIFEEDTPLNLIKAIRPDVLVKGADYTIDTVVGADIVIGGGGKVVLAKLEDGFSTTKTIKKMTLQ